MMSMERSSYVRLEKERRGGVRGIHERVGKWERKERERRKDKGEEHIDEAM